MMFSKPNYQQAIVHPCMLSLTEKKIDYNIRKNYQVCLGCIMCLGTLHVAVKNCEYQARHMGCKLYLTKNTHLDIFCVCLALCLIVILQQV